MSKALNIIHLGACGICPLPISPMFQEQAWGLNYGLWAMIMRFMPLHLTVICPTHLVRVFCLLKGHQSRQSAYKIQELSRSCMWEHFLCRESSAVTIYVFLIIEFFDHKALTLIDCKLETQIPPHNWPLLILLLSYSSIFLSLFFFIQLLHFIAFWFR